MIGYYIFEVFLEDKSISFLFIQLDYIREIIYREGNKEDQKKLYLIMEKLELII